MFIKYFIFILLFCSIGLGQEKSWAKSPVAVPPTYKTWTVVSSDVFRDVTGIHVGFNFGFDQETACFWGSVSSFNSNEVFIWNPHPGDYTRWSCRTTSIPRNNTNTATCSAGHIGDWWAQTGRMYYFGIGTVWVSDNFAVSDGTPYCIDPKYPLGRCGSMINDGNIMWVSMHTGTGDVSLYTTGDGTHYGKVVTFPNFATNPYQMEYGYSLQKKWGNIYVTCETTVIGVYNIASNQIYYIPSPDSAMFIMDMQSVRGGLLWNGAYPTGQVLNSRFPGGSAIYLYDGTTSLLQCYTRSSIDYSDIFERTLYWSNGKVYTACGSGGVDLGITYCHSWDGQVLRNEMESSMFGNTTGGKLECFLSNNDVLLAPHYKPLGYILVKSERSLTPSEAPNTMISTGNHTFEILFNSDTDLIKHLGGDLESLNALPAKPGEYGLDLNTKTIYKRGPSTFDTSVVTFHNTPTFYPEWFGAKGDGSTDDYIALMNTIRTAGQNATIVFRPGGIYAVGHEIAPLTGQRWIGYGACIKRKDEIKTTTVTSISTTSNVTVFTVADASKLREQMGITITNGHDHDEGCPSRHNIIAIHGNQVTVDVPFSIPFPKGGIVVTNHPVIAIWPEVSHVKIYGLEIDGNRANNDTYLNWDSQASIIAVGDYGLLKDLYIHDNQSDGIMVGGAGTVVDSNVILRSGGNAIHLSNASGVKITNNYLKDASLAIRNNDASTGPGHAEGVITFSINIKDTIISDNQIENGRTCIGGIGDSNNSDITIVNNTLRGGRYEAIEILSTDTSSNQLASNIVITGNRIYDSGPIQISAYPGKDTFFEAGNQEVLFSGNQLVNSSLVGLRLRKAVIVNNIIDLTQDSTDIALALYDSRRTVVSGNQITGGRYGIAAISQDTGHPMNLSRDIIISGNILRNQYNTGIYTDNSDGNEIHSLRIAGNEIVLDSADSSFFAAIVAPAGVELINNTIEQHGGQYGIIFSKNIEIKRKGDLATIVRGNTIRTDKEVPSIQTYCNLRNPFMITENHFNDSGPIVLNSLQENNAYMEVDIPQIIFSNNQMYHANLTGIGLQNAIITNNVIDLSGDTADVALGIYDGRQLTITDNNITGGIYGISATYIPNLDNRAKYLLQNIFISGNILHQAAKKEIVVEIPPDKTVQNVKISGNEIQVESPDSTFYASIVGASGVEVVNNTILQQGGQYGIVCGGDSIISPVGIPGTLVEENTIDAGKSIASIGILDGTKGSIVRNNRINQSIRNGSDGNNIVKDNDITYFLSKSYSK